MSRMPKALLGSSTVGRSLAGTRCTLVAFVAVLGLVVGACGGDGDAASEENTVTVYSGRNEELIKPILDRFTEETGTEVELRSGDSGEMAAQLLTEGDASPADVFISQDAGALGAVDEAGLLSTLPGDVTSLVDEKYRAVDDGWVGLTARSRVIIYNPNLVDDPPTTADEVLDPKWKGLIGFAPTNASWQSFVTGLRVLRGDDGAREWLEAFAAQDPEPYPNNAAVRDAVDAGDVEIGLINHYYFHELVAEKGLDNVVARNGYAAPGDPAGLINVSGIGVLESGDDEPAMELVRYLLGTEAQEYFANTTYEFPLIPGVATAPEVPPLESLQPPAIDLADLASIEQTQELLAEVGLLTK